MEQASAIKKELESEKAKCKQLENKIEEVAKENFLKGMDEAKETITKIYGELNLLRSKDLNNDLELDLRLTEAFENGYEKGSSESDDRWQKEFDELKGEFNDERLRNKQKHKESIEALKEELSQFQKGSNSRYLDIYDKREQLIEKIKENLEKLLFFLMKN